MNSDDRQKKREQLGSLRCKLHPMYNGNRMPVRSPNDKGAGCTCMEYFEAKRERFFDQLKEKPDGL